MLDLEDRPTSFSIKRLFEFGLILFVLASTSKIYLSKYYSFARSRSSNPNTHGHEYDRESLLHHVQGDTYEAPRVRRLYMAVHHEPRESERMQAHDLRGIPRKRGNKKIVSFLSEDLIQREETERNNKNKTQG